jgi:predicted transcriptional regulator
VSWDTLAHMLTTKRMELSCHVHGHETVSVRVLAKALGRDHSNVHADVQALLTAG